MSVDAEVASTVMPPIDEALPAQPEAGQAAHVVDQAQQTPVEALTTHVQLIAEQDDVLALPTIQPKSFLRLSGALSAGGALWVAAGETPVNIIEGIVVGGLAFLALKRAVISEPGRRDKTTQEKFNRGAQVAADAHYELFRIPGNGKGQEPRIAMRWYGPVKNPDEKTADELLAEVAELARQAGVDQLLVGEDLATKSSSLPKPGKTTTMAKWLKREEKISVGGHAKRDVIHVAEPAEWATFVRESRRGNASDKPKFAADLDKVDRESKIPLETLVTWLEADYPNHPALAATRKYAAKPADQATQHASVDERQALERRRAAQRKQDLLSTLKAGLVRQLQERDSPTPMMCKTSPWRGRAQATMVQITGERVTYLMGGWGIIHETTLDRVFNTDNIPGLRAMFDRATGPLSGSPKVHALEYALYKTLLNDKSPFDGLLEKNDEAVSARQPLQPLDKPPSSALRQLVYGEMSADKNVRISQSLQRMRRLAAACMGIAMGLGVGMVTHYTDRQYATVEQAAAAEIAHEQGYDPKQVTVDPEAIRDRVNSWSGWNRLWAGSVDGRTTVNDLTFQGLIALKDLFPEGSGNGEGPMGGISSTESAVGNVKNGNDQTTLWSLEPHNMDPTGLWISNVSNTLFGKKAADGHAVTMAWGFSSAPYTFERLEIPSTYSAYQASPWIDVSPDSWIKATRFVRPSEFIVNPKTGEAFLPLLVLQGTVPVAISASPPSVQMAIGDNGTYAMALHQKPDTVTKVEYWVAQPTQPLELQYRPHATKEREFAGDMLTNKRTANQLYGIPGYQHETDTVKRRALLVDYLQHHFNYDFSPYSDEDLRKITTWATFAYVTMQSNKANCNVASTLVALQDNKLNIAVGELNGSGEGQNSLQVNELHQLDVDKEGTFIDPTPSRKTVGSTGHEQPASTLPMAALLGLLVAAGVIAAQRKRLPHMVHMGKDKVLTLVADRAAAEMADLHISVLLATAAAVEQALYSKDGVVDTKKVMQRATDPTLTRAQAEKLMARSFIYGPTTQKHLRQQVPGAVTPTMRRTARLAGRMARRPAPRAKRRR